MPKGVKGFQKGREKTGGRKKGVKNKTSNIRDRLKALFLPYIDGTDPIVNLENDLKSLPPEERVMVVSKYLPFVIPKFTSTTITQDSERPLSEEQHLLEIDNAYKQQAQIKIQQLTIVNGDTGKTATLANKQVKSLIENLEQK